ncbi:GntR family transcriptional regulator [Streptomyces sp. NPDC101181]|uniref:GntR family transcriptional regulator n=1 Tax=Streptomyces sp. NPDC101181 TaxID=3366125 RepID=UPI0038030BEE
MEPQPTAVQAPIHLRIADDLRMQIERKDLPPGEPLPTLAEIRDIYDCSTNSARAAVALLKAQGLITSGRGKAPTVRIPLHKVVRSSARHQAEKDLARRPEKERGAVGEAETNLNMSITDQVFESTYERIAADTSLGSALRIESGSEVLRRRYVSHDSRSGLLLSFSTSYIPVSLVESNPDLLDASKEPWPGGTLHQLSTVDIEVMTVVDEVTGRMPTTVEAQQWGLPEGVPLLLCRRISLDATDRIVEISDAEYPADRTELHFITPLKAWRKRPTHTQAKEGN